MQVVVQVNNQVESGNMRTQVLKYDVTYDQTLGIARWQLLPGQSELIQSADIYSPGKDSLKPMRAE